MFLLLVYFPGNFFMAVAGRKQETRTVSVSIYYGSLILVFVLILLKCLEMIGKSDVLNRFVAALKIAATGKGQPDLSAVGIVFAASYGVSAFLGLVELFSFTGFFVLPEWMMRLLRRVCSVKPVEKAFNVLGCMASIFKGKPSGVRVNTGDLLVEPFVHFRRAGKRPFLEIVFKDGTVVKGECLRYTWNGTESVLLCGMDDPRELRWISLNETVSVRFLNLADLQERKKAGEELEKYLEDVKKSRKILNGLVPGYGDEVYGEILGKFKRTGR
ncbi:hypothetical protein [Desulfofundulus luciae]|uniref:hypothetical protein n=1 Tax=Desulfofundulus luciae TaxID=74702 RepID=UPI0027D8D404|nr:hypothetical protein [Desulfofundulus luciae]